MLRRKKAWVSLVGIIMCIGLWACTGEDSASLDGDGYAGIDDGFGDGDTAADYDGSGGGGGAASSSSGKPSTDTDPAFCTKIDGSQLGQAGVTAQAGAVTVTVTKWQKQSDKYVGFEYKTSGGMVWFGAKAGKEIFYHWGMNSWVNPHIETGGTVYGLSWIIFCEDDGTWIEDCPYANGDNPDAFDDNDSDGIPDGSGGSGDADGDGIPDAFDTDSLGAGGGSGGAGDGDTDGLPDQSNGVGDADGDGIPDAQDTDSLNAGGGGSGTGGSADGDTSGLDDHSNGTGDADGDGIPDAFDTDSLGAGGGNGTATDDEGCGTCNMDDVGTDDDTDTSTVVVV